MGNPHWMRWRLGRFGVDVGGRWQVLADIARTRIADDELIFVSLHYLMALVSAGGEADIEAMMAHLEDWAARPTTQGRVTARAGLELARGMRELRRGNHDRAVKAIYPIRYDLDPLGGSQAQRDLFWMMLSDAAAKGSDPRLAMALFAERTALKPHSAWGWEHYADSLVAVGQGDRAEAARETARGLAGG